VKRFLVILFIQQLTKSSLGYIPGASALSVVGDEVRKLKDRAQSGSYQEEVIYLLDRESEASFLLRYQLTIANLQP
jgi:hypothetical protein